ncbi:MAG TPA: ABC transporter permease [Xanthobacteraceae bacterium]|nr:ABC transporter permease [Xanthobacteraceae bacterium]
MAAPAQLDGPSGAVRSAAGAALAVRRRPQQHPTAWRIASLALFFLAWEIAGRIPISYAFPTFLETLRAFLRMLLDGSLVSAYAETLQPLIIGIAVSAVVGIGLGILMGLSPTAEWLAAPVFVVLQAAPMAALIPLITFVYGIGLVAKTLAVIMLALPVIVLNGYKAVRNVNPSLVDMCRSFQGSAWQRITRIIIPDASPVIFAGLRLGLAAGFIGVILAELLITPTGIGDLITYHRSVADYPEMYAAVVSIILASTLTLAALEAFELRVLRPEKRRR